VQHLSVRDHYVVVQTDRGQSTLLMRFADALGELDGIEGMRVHRSHWVAKTAVAGLERSGGKVHVRLQDGRLVPVSRSYRDEVETRADA
jgi:DNA-binding LytR/AlgR family response regulator